MGRGDSRSTRKMRRRRAQNGLKQRTARRAILTREARSQAKAAAAPAPTQASNKQIKKG